MLVIRHELTAREVHRIKMHEYYPTKISKTFKSKYLKDDSSFDLHDCTKKGLSCHISHSAVESHAYL